ncbi:MAG: divergent polysaccharide deacetylase family protein [Devosia sp.]|nr:divergent polysaccharide deacetylase family protein [Devosia sp.]
MADDLGSPLTRKKRDGDRPKPRWALDFGRLPLARIGFALVGLVLIGAVLRIVFVNDPEGGWPSSTVAINSTRDNNPIAGQIAPKDAAPAPASITAGPETPAAGPAAAAKPEGATADGQPDKQGIIADLAEETKDGPIPRISASGQLPFNAYARPADAADNGKPTIAIVVTGLGLNEAGTLDAVHKLPAEVDMAFAPYGKTLDRTVAAARAAGHELLLEAPMEPFDYPDTDPGPQTLLTGQPPRANLDKLYWLMARFGGYVAMINHTGARFTASAADFGPIMEELGTRGIGYLDDGTSNRSVAAQLAQADKVPFGRADLILDADPARAPILAALDQLASIATAKGQAIGIISALPVSIATVAEWAQTIDTHNVQLMPASALMK